MTKARKRKAPSKQSAFRLYLNACIKACALAKKLRAAVDYADSLHEAIDGECECAMFVGIESFSGNVGEYVAGKWGKP